MLKFRIPLANGQTRVVPVPRSVEARGPEALEQHYFALSQDASAVTDEQESDDDRS